MIDPDRLLAAYRVARDDLLAERDATGHWVGRLSSSALSTATATSALAVVARSPNAGQETLGPAGPLIARGLDYLAGTQNPDGGWGDTDKSLSNIATTMLVRAAFHLADAAGRHADLLARAEQYIDALGGVDGLRRRYGTDKTFAVPILTNCAIAGLVGWNEVAPLPFELACLPYPLLRFLRLPVVSYAVPALVAVGQAGYFHRKPRNPLTRLVRRLAVGRSLGTLARMQPDSGGFLEATPLTSFVVMCLASIGRADHPVTRRGVQFLVESARPDGSWPIDTDLATWVTTLSINALASSGEEVGGLGCLPWLLSCQHRRVHPFTNADPGGWGWSELSGAVPDADDTAGALLALAAVRPMACDDEIGQIDEAAARGIAWLLRLQNSDGGWPTFCRGWGALPFDRSGVDLTAHALRALHAWQGVSGVWSERVPAARAEAAIRRGLDYMSGRQQADGSWVPLWFGNQYHPAEENPVYGTARTLLGYRDLGLGQSEPARRGLAWLAGAQNADGGWGGDGQGQGERGAGSSLEETAIALSALLSAPGSGPLPSALSCTVDRAAAWLVEAVESGRHRETSPIGFYFAKLWYYERLYPLVFSVEALGLAARRQRAQPDGQTSRRPPSKTTC